MPRFAGVGRSLFVILPAVMLSFGCGGTVNTDGTGGTRVVDGTGGTTGTGGGSGGLGPIGPSGGTVTDESGASVSIPAGALSSETPITVDVVEGSDLPKLADGVTAVGPFVELTPHGTQFTVSVTVTLPYISTSTSLSVISIEDENDATWEEITGSSFDDGTATVELDHFSFLTVAAGTPAACGNGLIDGTEQCDGINLRGESCETQGFVGGTLGCAADCTAFDVNGCTVGPVCGDNVDELPEVCDGTDLAGEDCASQGFAGGTLGCKVDCTGFDTSGCTGGGPGDYDVDLRFLSSLSPSVQQAFVDAVARWESVVIGDLADVPVNVPSGLCFQGQPAIDETIDDLLIFADVTFIDGPGGILGRAGTCAIRSANKLTVFGLMQFDEDDLAELEAQGALGDVIVHEMGHVIGFGTVWEVLGFLADPSLQGGTDPHFTGPRAIAAFDGLGGAGYSGAKVPVENTGGPGTADGHWRESVLDNELMTGWLNPGSNPLSELTVESLWDMGYSVDLDAADDFAITLDVRQQSAATSLSLGDDILTLPIWVVDEEGRVVEVIENR